MKADLVLQGTKRTQHALISLVRISGLEVSCHKRGRFLVRPSQSGCEHLISGLGISSSSCSRLVLSSALPDGLVPHCCCFALQIRNSPRLHPATCNFCRSSNSPPACPFHPSSAILNPSQCPRIHGVLPNTARRPCRPGILRAPRRGGALLLRPSTYASFQVSSVRSQSQPCFRHQCFPGV